ncbi:MAG TPA: sigma-70 family RNA polymerase sigma factor [Flavobacteriaceae bacterium]|nr:sigma-70 family RNA polymerase sigma factor [Flavobacteriaceae bacterium]
MKRIDQGNLSDAVLVRLYLNGEEQALNELIIRHKQRIYNFIYSKVYDRDITEDIFQDAFIRVIRTLKGGKYNEQGKFLPWVMRITHNLIIDHFRKTNRMPKFENREDFDIFSVLTDDSMNAEGKMIKEQIEGGLQSLVDTLPEEQQIVLHMRIYRDMSFKEISEQTGVSINTALGRMRYALINLRRTIEENNIILTK